jgi:hypothetical protein
MTKIKALAVHPGQRVLTTQGTTRTVAFTSRGGQIYAYGLDGGLEPISVVCDAWGGEHDQTLGLAA